MKELVQGDPNYKLIITYDVADHRECDNNHDMKKVYRFFFLNNFNKFKLIFAIFAHITQMIRFTKTSQNLTFEIYLSLGIANVNTTSSKMPFLR